MHTLIANWIHWRGSHTSKSKKGLKINKICNAPSHSTYPTNRTVTKNLIPNNSEVSYLGTSTIEGNKERRHNPLCPLTYIMRISYLDTSFFVGKQSRVSSVLLTT